MKLNKKVNLFGKEVSVFALVLIGMVALGSAALVPYLSGLVTGNTTVDSPLTLVGATGAIAGSNSWGSAGFVPADGSFTVGASGNLFTTATHHGGESDGFWLKATNNADQIVQGYIVFEINNNKGITKEEVKTIIPSIYVFDWAHDGTTLTARTETVGLTDFDGSCNVGGDTAECDVVCNTDGKTCRVYIKTYLWTATANNEYVKVPVSFPLNAIGTYTVKGAIFDTSKEADVKNANTALVFPTA